MTKCMCRSASAPTTASPASMRVTRALQEFVLLMLLVTLLISAGCNMAGAGGAGGNGSSAPPPPPPPATPSAPNELPVIVSAGPGQNTNLNRPYVSVTVCVPGTSDCQTINNVLLDTGSTGLRLFSSVVTIPLPIQQPFTQFFSTYECYPFESNYAWGPVATADVKLPGETAPGAAIQLMGDTTYTPPASLRTV
jgi:hypothetical protein